jgi:hypothetical protein
MQTTVSNDSNITVFVFNASIEVDEENSKIQFAVFYFILFFYIGNNRTSSSDSTSFLLRLIVYYVYPIACDECLEISNNAVYGEPRLNQFIQIRNATLIDISPPILVNDISKYSNIYSDYLRKYYCSFSEPHRIITSLSPNDTGHL